MDKIPDVRTLLCSDPKYSSGKNWSISLYCTYRKYVSSKSNLWLLIEFFYEEYWISLQISVLLPLAQPRVRVKSERKRKSRPAVWVGLKRSMHKKLRAAKISPWRFFYSVGGLPCPRHCLRLGLTQNRKSRASAGAGLDKDYQRLACKSLLRAKGYTGCIWS